MDGSSLAIGIAIGFAAFLPIGIKEAKNQIKKKIKKENLRVYKNGTELTKKETFSLLKL